MCSSLLKTAEQIVIQSSCMRCMCGAGLLFGRVYPAVHVSNASGVVSADALHFSSGPLLLYTTAIGQTSHVHRCKLHLKPAGTAALMSTVIVLFYLLLNLAGLFGGAPTK